MPRSSNMADRLYQFAACVAEKTAKKKEELEQKALVECSFQPKTKSKEEDRRAFEDFIQQ